MAVTEKNSSCWPDRRAFLSTGAAMVIAALATRDGVAQEPEKTDRCSASDAGPGNRKTARIPNTFLPPSTDQGEVPTFWNSFYAS
jgi:hypothetical protein